MDFAGIIDKLTFLIALLAGEVLIFSRIGWKKYGAVRLAAGIIPAVLLSLFGGALDALLPRSWTMALISSRYLAIFLATLPALFFAFRGDFWTVLFAGVMAYCAQHIGYQLHYIVRLLTGDRAGFYGQLGILLLTTCAVYLLLYFGFVRKLKKGALIKVNNPLQVLVSCAVLILTVYVSFYGIVFAMASKILALQYVVLTFSILSSFMAIQLEISLVTLKQNEMELAVLKHMLHQAKLHYAQTKENIDTINIKCHDLRHQISHLRGQIDEEELQKITEAVQIYDASYKTGNDALDIVLMEKSLHCIQRNIRMTCMIDPAVVAPMKDSDIYSLFGNAIENAMESVSDLEEERRSISISGAVHNGCAVIRIENYYDGQIAFSEGLPVTKKSEKYHGFGVKSMKILAEKYGGDVEFSLHGDIFRLEIFFSLMST